MQVVREHERRQHQDEAEQERGDVFADGPVRRVFIPSSPECQYKELLAEFLSQRPFIEGFVGNNMQMQVEHGLTSSGTIVDHQAKGVVYTKLFRDLARDQQ
jgi:hypothetical protein